jgi:hypothetical protein
MTHDWYIMDVAFSLIECTCEIVLTTTPDTPAAQKTLLFSGVGNARANRYHAPEYTLGDFAGIREKRLDEARSEFTLNTGDGNIVFEAWSEYVTIETGRHSDRS